MAYSTVSNQFLPGAAQLQLATKASSTAMPTSTFCRPRRAVNNAHDHGHNAARAVKIFKNLGEVGDPDASRAPLWMLSGSRVISGGLYSSGESLEMIQWPTS